MVLWMRVTITIRGFKKSNLNWGGQVRFHCSMDGVLDGLDLWSGFHALTLSRCADTAMRPVNTKDCNKMRWGRAWV